MNIISFLLFQNKFVRRKKLSDISFEDIFAGPPPNFNVSICKKKPSMPTQSSGFDFTSKIKEKKTDGQVPKRKYKKRGNMKSLKSACLSTMIILFIHILFGIFLLFT